MSSWRERHPDQWAQLYTQGFVKGASDRARNRARLENLDERAAGEHGRSWALEQLRRPENRRAKAMPWPPLAPGDGLPA